MSQPYELTASNALRELRSGTLSAWELVTALLDRIAAIDSHLQAWETLAPRAQLEDAARAFDDARTRGETVPTLPGLPFGVKDIFFTSGLRTAAGFAPYDAWVPDADAAAMAQLRKRGALVLGKTVTTQFAFSDPARTFNPWRSDRTPGGSSSGSAAAVAARMIPLALGTQTAGSVLRPAAYCGVIGFKPSYGRLSTMGVLPLAWSLDHVGIICRAVEDIAVVLDTPLPTPVERPVLGLVADLLEAAEPEVREQTAAIVQKLESAGASVREIRLPMDLQDVLAIHHVTMQAEVAAVHTAQLERYPDAYAPLLRRYVEAGQLLPAYGYQHAQRLRARFRRQVATLFDELELNALMMPTASNTAPGRETTGDTRFQAVWTLIGVPSISLPSGLSGDGLPFGLQFAGRSGEDEALLDVAAWCEQALGPMPAPPDPVGRAAAGEERKPV